jgi:hypothetical protein
LLGLTRWEYEDSVTTLLGEIGSMFISSELLREMLISGDSFPADEEAVTEAPVDPTPSLSDDEEPADPASSSGDDG